MELLYTIETSENKIILKDEKSGQTSVIGSFYENQHCNKNLEEVKTNRISFPTPWELRGECVNGSTYIDKADKKVIVGILAAIIGVAAGTVGAAVAGMVTLIYDRVLAGQKDFYYRKCWYHREVAPYEKEYKTVVTMYEDSNHNRYIGEYVSEAYK